VKECTRTAIEEEIVLATMIKDLVHILSDGFEQPHKLGAIS
jgi:hypothetical protein